MMTNLTDVIQELRLANQRIAKLEASFDNQKKFNNELVSLLETAGKRFDKLEEFAGSTRAGFWFR